uniref:Prefoldin subunit 4 n=1 Tax=Percolomonas cosmopolitus TaxID=63605 RepID=A0A7S1KND5_9EUKA|eukprot:CAMPEP_0117445568 /NCGR_PEP_ID=MMETSP0759-20121206/5866_1 /TAXON_ID=63605 /ORGANISM="Percolomonas cosmopolitus, Strain WS" /LENGTH=132 /DNA_ID=CAMNT_0005237755 /DNA_START=11 /DNA_END=409 /DNA_ORIENTATION=+
MSTSIRPKPVNDAKQIQVTFEDQQSINSFGRLNTYYQDLEEEVKTLKDEIDRHTWGAEEIWSAESIKFSVGEMFVEMNDPDQAETAINTQLERKKKLLEEKEHTLERIAQKMSELKSALYAKFGKNNINLDA